MLCPTWGRPGRLTEFVRSALETATYTHRLEILVRVSEEDSFSGQYLQLVLPTTVKWFVVRGWTGYPAAIEMLQQHAAGELLFCGSDDSLFRTPGWDVMADEAFNLAPDGLLVAYANNGQDREKCEQFFTTRRWIDTVGWLMRPEYEHFCCDQDIEALANGVGRLKFLRGLTVEHMHKKYGKAPNDATYERVRGNTGTNARDLATFDRLAPERAGAIERLREAIGA